LAARLLPERFFSMPSPVPAAAANLIRAWRDHADQEAARQLVDALYPLDNL
jgi:hypothetical protein